MRLERFVSALGVAAAHKSGNSPKRCPTSVAAVPAFSRLGKPGETTAN
jgi:hypothetical protein